MWIKGKNLSLVCWKDQWCLFCGWILSPALSCPLSLWKESLLRTFQRLEEKRDDGSVCLFVCFLNFYFLPKTKVLRCFFNLPAFPSDFLLSLLLFFPPISLLLPNLPPSFSWLLLDAASLCIRNWAWVRIFCFSLLNAVIIAMFYHPWLSFSLFLIYFFKLWKIFKYVWKLAR